MNDMIVADDQYVTRRDLVEAFEDFGRTFAVTLTNNITTLFRDELDSKLAASERRQMARMENMLDERTDIILQGMHDVVVRLEAKDDELDQRVSRLEAKAT